MAKRITLTLILGLCCFSFIGIAGLSYKSYVDTLTHFDQLGQQNAMLGAARVGYAIERSMGDANFELADAFDDNYQSSLSATHVQYAYAINENRFVSIHTDPSLNEQLIAENASGKSGIQKSKSSRTHQQLGEIDCYEYSYPVQVADQQWGEFHVGVPVAVVRQESLRQWTILFVAGLTTLASIGCFICLTVRWHLNPLAALRQVSSKMAQGDWGKRAEVSGNHELSELAESLNSMAITIEKSRPAMWEQQEETEQLISQKTLELEQTQQDLLVASQQARMADLSSGILHNVGNVLNSVNVTSHLLMENARSKSLAHLGRVIEMLNENQNDIEGFLARDPKGKKCITFLTALNEQLQIERKDSIRELRSLSNNIDHIKQIISTQQQVAKQIGVAVVADTDAIFEEAIAMQRSESDSPEIAIHCESLDHFTLSTDKHLVLQILVNFLGNAQDAILENSPEQPVISCRVSTSENHVILAVEDNGIGIDSETLPKLFQHGFTTKATGHGFGLHSSALAARALNGQIKVESDGCGLGATFSLLLPASCLVDIPVGV